MMAKWMLGTRTIEADSLGEAMAAGLSETTHPWLASMIIGYWLPIRDGDLRLRALYNRHYSAYHYKDGRRPVKTAGPGEYMALMTVDSQAAWIWRKFIDDSGERGINCALFRNEGPILSSLLIREACELAWLRWAGERLYTYVDPAKVQSGLAGNCYLMAGWHYCRTGRHRRRTKSGKLILERQR